MMESIHNIGFACPCCGFLTLDEQPPGSYNICPVCFWEDDPLQFDDPEYPGGANRVTLRQARENFTKIGACEAGVLDLVRPPRPYEVPPRPANRS